MEDKTLSHEEFIAVRDALKQSEYEFITLIPRLHSQFRTNAQAILKNVKGALAILESKR
jgi:hypothetical protein